MMCKTLSGAMGQKMILSKGKKTIKIRNAIFLKENRHRYHSLSQSTRILLPNCLPSLKTIDTILK